MNEKLTSEWESARQNRREINREPTENTTNVKMWLVYKMKKTDLVEAAKKEIMKENFKVGLKDEVKDVNGKRKNKEKREIDEDVREKKLKRERQRK